MRTSSSSRSPWMVPLLAVLVTAPCAAQIRVRGTPMDSTGIATMAGIAFRMLRPAQFVLDHRTEVGLTAEQVPVLESLAAAQRDSEPPRQRRASALARAAFERRGGPPATMQSLSWTGPVNEQAIRDAACDQSVTQAEVMINMAHDRRAVAAVLTPAQVAALPRLEGLEMMRGMPPGPRGTAAVQSGVPFFEYQVEKQAQNVSGQQPKYPDELRAAKVEGQVLAQFVVDTTGHVEPATFKVLLSSHALFTQAVRDALPGMQFLPAEVGGHKVRQLVQQPFVFTAPQQD